MNISTEDNKCHKAAVFIYMSKPKCQTKHILQSLLPDIIKMCRLFKKNINQYFVESELWTQLIHKTHFHFLFFPPPNIPCPCFPRLYLPPCFPCLNFPCLPCLNLPPWCIPPYPMWGAPYPMLWAPCDTWWAPRAAAAAAAPPAIIPATPPPCPKLQESKFIIFKNTWMTTMLLMRTKRITRHILKRWGSIVNDQWHVKIRINSTNPKIYAASYIRTHNFDTRQVI